MNIILGGILSLSVITSIPTKVVYQAEPIEEITTLNMSTQELVDFYADKWEVPREDLHTVVKCESSYRADAVNMQDSHKLSNGSWGISQFSKETFAQYAKEMGREYTNPMNPREALDVMGYMFSKGKQKHWSCARLIK